MNDFSSRLLALRKSMGLTQSQMADRMGLSMSYIHQLEAAKRTPSDSVLTIMRMLEEQMRVGLITETGAPVALNEQAASYGPKMIHVVGWAHAGDAASYEELPEGWKDKIPTECRDPKAFGVRLEGDSMEPKFSEGDILVLQPSEEAHSGCLVVARFRDDGVIFRRIEMTGKTITLVPLNSRYQASQHEPTDFAWIYPVWGRFTLLWRK